MQSPEEGWGGVKLFSILFLKHHLMCSVLIIGQILTGQLTQTETVSVVLCNKKGTEICVETCTSDLVRKRAVK